MSAIESADPASPTDMDSNEYQAAIAELGVGGDGALVGGGRVDGEVVVASMRARS